MKEKPLSQLKDELKKTEHLIKVATMYNGKIRMGDDIVTVDELEKLRLDIKSEIAVRYSTNSLRIVK